MKLGFIGTGEITKAVVIGILGSKLKFKKIYLSERNKKISSFLRRKNIGYIHQQNSLLTEFNAYENIYLTLLLNGFNSSYAKEKALELLKIVNLEIFFHYLFQQLYLNVKKIFLLFYLVEILELDLF